MPNTTSNDNDGSKNKNKKKSSSSSSSGGGGPSSSGRRSRSSSHKSRTKSGEKDAVEMKKKQKRSSSLSSQLSQQHTSIKSKKPSSSSSSSSSKKHSSSKDKKKTSVDIEKGKKTSTTTNKNKNKNKETTHESGSSSSSKSKLKQRQEAKGDPSSLPQCVRSYHNNHMTSNEHVERLRDLAHAHVESYNYFLTEGLHRGIQDLDHVEILIIDPEIRRKVSAQVENNITSGGGRGGGVGDDNDAVGDDMIDYDNVPSIEYWIEEVRIGKPKSGTGGDRDLTPRECRERHITYGALMIGMICYRLHQRKDGYIVKSSPIIKITRSFGNIPIMIMSKHCHLYNTSLKRLVIRHKEEDHEFGGYFICNGIEKVIRMLQIPRRNHAVALRREAFRKRGNIYTDIAVTVRCTRHNHDQTSITNVIHYLTTGGVTLYFLARKNQFLIPVILIIRALSGGNPTDHKNDKKKKKQKKMSNENDVEDIVSMLINDKNNDNDSDDDDYDDGCNDYGNLGITDEEIYDRIVQGDTKNTFLVARAGLLLQDARARFRSRRRTSKNNDENNEKDQNMDDDDDAMNAGCNTPNECLQYIGARLRHITIFPETTSDIEIGHYVIRKYILIHLENYRDKLEYLLFLIRKLYTFASGNCGNENADSLQNHDLLLSGHFMSAYVKEKFDELLQRIRMNILIDIRKTSNNNTSTGFQKFVSNKINDIKYWERIIDRSSSASSGSIGQRIRTFLSTGTMVSSTGLDLMQETGYTVVAERINMFRYMSHFRAVHRGSFFQEMRTTAVRKLLPDQWGFMCPVHTPDGTPCGLLSHLSISARVVTTPALLTPFKNKNSKVQQQQHQYVDMDELLISLGVSPVGAGGSRHDGRSTTTYHNIPVCLDGRIIGSTTINRCKYIVQQLRLMKVETSQNAKIPSTIEIALFPPGNSNSPYPGLFLYTDAGRLIRPVLQLSTQKTEYIGPLEQNYMDIACLNEDIRDGITTHYELHPTNILSYLANLTPFSDQNQSPRNMYQCQMCKQTMGTPYHSLIHRTDNKIYKLQTPQAPIVQTSIHGELKADEYPNGTNAIVAVLSYTGFDMEDAMILNKGSFERGFAHASVYKTLKVDIADEAKAKRGGQSDVRLQFKNKIKDGEILHPTLDSDGLPRVGDRVTKGSPLHCIVDQASGTDRVGKHKDKETAYVQSIRFIGSDSGSMNENKVSMTIRYPRNPVIGDKFSSRHGQKGVLSIKWPHEDMPFTESGITPDVIINPHAFPSRMTIGMLVESMAAKGGALHGHYQNATPFQFHESGDIVSVDYFGEQLMAAGYNYYGSEALYSGVSGCVMEADLYIGIVYYQRLRHMVSDKYQVRATGPVNELTHQPIKGRKRGGGIRLGEMERDSLVSHGTAFLLQDRLMNCSDKHVGYVCSRCGDMLFPRTERHTLRSTGQSMKDAINKPMLKLVCKNPTCLDATYGDDDDEAVEPIALPYVYRYLVNELAGMNIRLKLEIK